MSTSPLIAPTDPPASRYWGETARPLTSLLFVLPMLLGYEAGIWLLGDQAPRNGAEVFLWRGLTTFGLQREWWLPVLAVALLMAWHYARRDTWKIEWRYLPWMLVESVCYGVGLLFLAQWLFGFSLSGRDGAASADLSILHRIVAYLGAGFFEEVLFRLLLMSACCWLLTSAGWKAERAWIAAAGVASILFAAAHYQWTLPFIGQLSITSSTELFAFRSFFFRTLAGLYFSLLFGLRGFGICAGTHACYDLLLIFGG